MTKAQDGDTIVLLKDAETSGLNLSKNVTIDGNESQKHSLTFTDKGIALWGKELALNNLNIVMNGIGSTPYSSEWGKMAICASKNSAITLNNTTMTMDGTGTKSNTDAIYFTGNNKLNLNDSTLIIKNYPYNALVWDGGDGGYNVNLVNSTLTSDNNRSALTGTFYATIDHSNLNVLNSKGNGSNGTYFTIKNGSNVMVENNGSWGLSAWRIDMTNDSTLTATDNGLSGIWTRVLNVDGTCTLDVERNGKKGSSTSNAGITFQGNGKYTSTVEKGANVIIKDNDGSGIYTRQTVCNLTLHAGEITNNGSGSVGAIDGGGIYNIGTLNVGEDVVIEFNKASQYGGGIFNADSGKVNVEEGAKIFNNAAARAGDDIYSTGTITFPGVGENWFLEPSHIQITGWYDDDEESRYRADQDLVRDDHIVPKEAGTYTEEFAIKAAYNIFMDITIHYVDENGNPIREDDVSQHKVLNTEALPTYSVAELGSSYGKDIDMYVPMQDENGDPYYEGDTLSGNIDGHKEITLYYHSPVQVIVQFVDVDGNELMESSVESVKYGSTYNVSSKADTTIDEYTRVDVRGDALTDVAKTDKLIVVVYDKVVEPENEDKEDPKEEKKENPKKEDRKEEPKKKESKKKQTKKEERKEEPKQQVQGVQTSTYTGLTGLVSALTLSGVAALFLRKKN